MKSVRLLFALLVAACVAATATSALAAPGASAPDPQAQQGGDEYVPGADALEGKIISPCCWTQTIDIHDSEIARQLRHEVRARLKGGESQDAILQSMVARYGTRILAVPPGNPLKTTAVILAVVFGVAGAGAGSMLMRWRRQSRAAGGGDPEAGPAERDELDDRIDDELDKL